VIASLIGSYRPIRKPALITYLYNPAVNPPKSAKLPSSAAIVLAVPISPTYRGFSPATTF